VSIYDDDLAGAERGHAKAADDISRAFEAGETLIDRVGRRVNILWAAIRTDSKSPAALLPRSAGKPSMSVGINRRAFAADVKTD
jgi:hypothetical protein